MNQPRFELPDTLSEIHFGFLSGKHFVGSADIGKCNLLRIEFDGNFWNVSAAFQGTVYSKKYRRNLDTGLLTAVND